MKTKAIAGKIVGCHYVSKARCQRAGNRLYAEGDAPVTEGENPTPLPTALFVKQAGEKLEEFQVEGIENVSEFFTKINHVEESAEPASEE